MALAPWLDTPGAPDWRASLEIVRDKLRPMLGELDALGFPPEDLPFKMPRDGNAQFQYFERLLGVHESGRRLIYAEGLTTRAAALDLLGTIVTDRGAGIYFFDEVMRMDRDVMADGARKRLDQIFPPASK